MASEPERGHDDLPEGKRGRPEHDPDARQLMAQVETLVTIRSDTSTPAHLPATSGETRPRCGTDPPQREHDWRADPAGDVRARGDRLCIRCIASECEHRTRPCNRSQGRSTPDADWPQPGHQHDRWAYLAAVRALWPVADHDFGGGVPTPAVARSLETTVGTARAHLQTLADAGYLVERHGLSPEMHRRKSWEPRHPSDWPQQPSAGAPSWEDL